MTLSGEQSRTAKTLDCFVVEFIVGSTEGRTRWLLAMTAIPTGKEQRVANNVKKVWASGKAVVNAWLAIPSGFSAEVIAQCGFDSVTVDMQHGVQDYQSMVQCFQAMNG